MDTPKYLNQMAEYFNQDEYYFSESSGQVVAIHSMPFQQAFYSHRKLVREFGEAYLGTHLYRRLNRKVCPTPDQVRLELSLYGKACHAVNEPGPRGVPLRSTNSTAVRAKLANAAKRGHKKVRTHIVRTGAGSWMEATILVDGKIQVKGKEVTNG